MGWGYVCLNCSDHKLAYGSGGKDMIDDLVEQHENKNCGPEKNIKMFKIAKTYIKSIRKAKNNRFGRYQKYIFSVLKDFWMLYRLRVNTKKYRVRMAAMQLVLLDRNKDALLEGLMEGELNMASEIENRNMPVAPKFVPISLYKNALEGKLDKTSKWKVEILREMKRDFKYLVRSPIIFGIKKLKRETGFPKPWKRGKYSKMSPRELERNFKKLKDQKDDLATKWGNLSMKFSNDWLKLTGNKW